MDEFSYGTLKYDAYIPRILDRHVAFALEDKASQNDALVCRKTKKIISQYVFYNVRKTEI